MLASVTERQRWRPGDRRSGVYPHPAQCWGGDMKRFALRTAAKCLSIGAVLIATCVAADALMNTNPPPDSHTCLGCGCVWYSGPNGSSCSC